MDLSQTAMDWLLTRLPWLRPQFASSMALEKFLKTVSCLNFLILNSGITTGATSRCCCEWIHEKHLEQGLEHRKHSILQNPSAYTDYSQYSQDNTTALCPIYRRENWGQLRWKFTQFNKDCSDLDPSPVPFVVSLFLLPDFAFSLEQQAWPAGNNQCCQITLTWFQAESKVPDLSVSLCNFIESALAISA